MADKLGQKEASKLLHEILEQEKATDEKLTKLSGDIEEEAMKQAA
jgi:ferritin-like metal-binding protein YciE